MALTDASVNLPVIGKHLEPFAMLTAMGLWGYRHAPSFVSTMARNITGALDTEQREADRSRTHEVCAAALGHRARRRTHRRMAAAGPAAAVVDLCATPPAVRAVRPGAVRRCPEQVMDVWRRSDLPAEAAPVLIFVPGVRGCTASAHYRAMRCWPNWPRRAGSVCRSTIGPRPNTAGPVISPTSKPRSPNAANVDRFGGDRDFVTIAGCSAGGHLAALAGLTHDDDGVYEELHPEPTPRSMRWSGSTAATTGRIGRHRNGNCSWDSWRTSSSASVTSTTRICIARPHRWRGSDPRPPFFVVHGSSDSLIPVEQARSFVEQLRAVSRSAVGYLELPGTGHGFDMLDGSRTASTAMAIRLFLEQVRRDHLQNRTKRVI